MRCFNRRLAWRTLDTFGTILAFGTVIALRAGLLLGALFAAFAEAFATFTLAIRAEPIATAAATTEIIIAITLALAAFSLLPFSLLMFSGCLVLAALIVLVRLALIIAFGLIVVLSALVARAFALAAFIIGIDCVGETVSHGLLRGHLGLHRAEQTEIMFGVLQIVFRDDAVSS